ncbi:MAG: DUF4129 domain-containing protein [Gemmatimonadota bacterium]
MPADSVRRAVREVFARPEYDWVQTARPLHWLRDLWMRFRAWLDAFATQHPLGAKLLFWAALLALIALLAHIGLTVWRIYRVTVQQPGGTGAAPAPELLDSRGHLARAESLARTGRYTEALAHRFIVLLLELDRADALTFHPSKTPAEYVREARLGATGRATMAGLVSRLYHHVFGAEPLDERGYREFGAAAGTLLHHVEPH